MKRFCPERFAPRRRELGLTQRELARRALISAVSLSAIENGHKEPRAGTLGRLAAELQAGVDYFYLSN